MSYFDSATKIWHGPKVIESPRSFVKELFEHLQKTPNKTAQYSIDEKTELTYNDLRLLSIRVAQNLLKIGVKSGDVIGIIAKNSTYVAPVALGCFLIGAPINPLDASFEDEDIKHLWAITRPTIIFSDYDKVDRIQKISNDLMLKAKIFTFIENVEGFSSIDEVLEATEYEDSFQPTELPNDAIAIISCSSGTTAASKGISCTQANLLKSTYLMEMHDGSRTFCCSSLYWITGVIFLIGPIFSNVTRIITKINIEVEKVVDILDKYKITHTFLSAGSLANVMKFMRKNNRSCLSMKIVLSGGSFIYKHVRKGFKEFFPNAELNIAYGMSETHMISKMINDANVESTSTGCLIENVQAKIVDCDDGKCLGRNEIGEIFVKLDENVCIGYYKNKEATENSVDSEGFFITGDLGYFDDAGYLHISDRRTDTIKVFDPDLILVFPSNIENVLINLSGVQEVCVVGLRHPIHIEVIAAVIIRQLDHDVNEQEVSQEVYKQLKPHLFGGVFFVDEFPRTPSGKVKKRLVKTIANEMFTKIHNFVF